MVDRFTEVTERGWLSRIGESIKGVVAGLVMFFVAFPLLWFNEGRSVQTYKSLQEGRGAVVAVSADSVDAANEGALVHVSGHAATQETLRDPTFAVSVAGALRLQRKVEMYQWVERKETKTRKKTGGKEVKETTYDYSKEWREKPVPSAEFRRAEDHRNPSSMPFSSDAWQAQNVTLGSFVLSDSLTARIDKHERLAVTETMREGLPDDLRSSVRIYDEGYFLGQQPSEPAIGDVRVRFSRVPNSDVSIVAQQVGQSFSTYQTDAGDALEMLSLGTLSADAMFTSAEQSNVVLTWGMRLFGFLLMAIGVGMIFRPLIVVADVIPLIGSLVGLGVGLLAVSIAAPLSLMTIALAWIFYRPLLGIALLAVAVGIFFWALRYAAARKAAAEATS